MSTKTSLTIDVLCSDGMTDLVRTSAICSYEGTNERIIVPVQTSSQIKWMSILLCLDRLGRTESEVSIMAD